MKARSEGPEGGPHRAVACCSPRGPHVLTTWPCAFTDLVPPRGSVLPLCPLPVPNFDSFLSSSVVPSPFSVWPAISVNFECVFPSYFHHVTCRFIVRVWKGQLTFYWSRSLLGGGESALAHSGGPRQIPSPTHSALCKDYFVPVTNCQRAAWPSAFQRWGLG